MVDIDYLTKRISELAIRKQTIEQEIANLRQNLATKINQLNMVIGAIAEIDAALQIYKAKQEEETEEKPEEKPE